MAQGAERGGVGLLDGQSGHGMILFVFVCFPWPLCQVWIFQKLEVVVNSRRQFSSSKGEVRNFGISQCERAGYR